MSIVKRGRKWFLAIRPYGKQVWIDACTENKTRAVDIERQILIACKSGDFGFLDAGSRAVAIQMFRNQKWEIPTSLGTGTPEQTLTLWNAVQLCLKSPSMSANTNRSRVEYSFFHIVSHFGKDFSIKDLWIPQIREYLLTRQKDGAAASTINKEKAALSMMFQNLMESRLVEANPARMVKSLSEKSGQRQRYISQADFQRILEAVPSWFRPIAQTAYYTGMRRGEILNLTRSCVDLTKRIISLRPAATKEREWKRIPIHRELMPILKAALSDSPFGLCHVFLKNGHDLTNKDAVRWCWDRPVDKLEGLEGLRFHDLRHTWKTNARRSGMDPEIRESIMGHSTRTRSVSERYGHLSDEELVRSIDLMTFDHGDTIIRGDIRTQKEDKKKTSSESHSEQVVRRVLDTPTLSIQETHRGFAINS